MIEKNRIDYVTKFEDSQMYADGFNPSDLIGSRGNIDENVKFRNVAYPKSKYVKAYLRKYIITFIREKENKGKPVETRITDEGAWLGNSQYDQDMITHLLLDLSELMYLKYGKNFDIKPSGKPRTLKKKIK